MCVNDLDDLAGEREMRQMQIAGCISRHHRSVVATDADALAPFPTHFLLNPSPTLSPLQLPTPTPLGNSIELW